MTEKRSDPYDVVIVGGSFAGLAAAMPLGRVRRRVLVIDSGRPRNATSPAAHGFLGQDGRPPAEVLKTFREQVGAYPTVDFLVGAVDDVQKGEGEGVFVVGTAGGERISARRIVLATGVVDDLPSVPGLAERWGDSVLHCPYCHGFEVADRRLGVLATSEANLHQVRLLGDLSRDVTLFTNGALHLSHEQETAMQEQGVRIETDVVAGLLGEGTRLEALSMRDGRTVPIDALFTGSRSRFASDIAERLGCGIDEGPFGPMVATTAKKETTIPGVFCAGDAAHAPHSITFAVADGALAGLSTHQSLVFGGEVGR